MTVRAIDQSKLTQSEGKVGAYLASAMSSVTESSRMLAAEVAGDLLDTMAAHEICVGLAANQIGSDLRVAVVSFPGLDREPLVLVNPVILSTSGKKDRKRESCMSVWGKTGEVERRDKIEVAYENLDLEAKRESFSGFVGRIVQHEVDHLEGILFTDHVANGGLSDTNLFTGERP